MKKQSSVLIYLILKNFIEPSSSPKKKDPLHIPGYSEDDIHFNIGVANRYDFLTAADISTNGPEGFKIRYKILEIRWSGFNFHSLVNSIEDLDKTEKEIQDKSGLEEVPLDLLLEYLKVQEKIRRAKK